MRKTLAYILSSVPMLEVIDTAADGQEAINKVARLHPDVVLLDIEMPVMDGLTALAQIMEQHPTPVLMLSALNKRDAMIAIKSLEYGAVDFIPKPSGVISYDIENLAHDIIAKVEAAAGVNVHQVKRPAGAELNQYQKPALSARKKLVVIGASTGGPKAVAQILAGLRREITAAIIIVQHMGPEFIPPFADRLRLACPLRISVARKGDAISMGQVMVAPGGYHTVIMPDGRDGKVRLSRKVSPLSISPSIDYTMESAARVYGEDTLGVLLTGLGSDGVKGLKTIKAAGGSTMAQDKSTSVIYGMPRAAVEAGCVDEIVPLPRMAQAILRMI